MLIFFNAKKCEKNKRKNRAKNDENFLKISKSKNIDVII